MPTRRLISKMRLTTLALATVAVTSSCTTCMEGLVPAPNVSVVDADGVAVEGLILKVVVPGRDSIVMEESPGGYYGAYGANLPAGTYKIVLDSDAYAISGTDELVVHEGDECSDPTGRAIITVAPK